MQLTNYRVTQKQLELQLKLAEWKALELGLDSWQSLLYALDGSKSWENYQNPRF